VEITEWEGSFTDEELARVALRTPDGFHPGEVAAALGSPATEAVRIAADPLRVLRRLQPHLGEVRGRRICSVQASHGRIAMALALLGADATVIDFAEENRRYGLALADAAGVRISYESADVMDMFRCEAG
jgi:2-polyprenyl-3-methyl-5-hydroxy-6-metoxy-1,4-benzoquinol methylase